MSSMIHISALADGMLSAVLLLLWLVQPNGRHALLWGLAQLLLGGMNLIWFGVIDLASPAVISLALAMTLVAGSLLYVQGTLFFLYRRQSWRRFCYTALILVWVFMWMQAATPESVVRAGLILLGSCLLWCGARLAVEVPAYRIVGVILVLRGLLNYLFVPGLTDPAWLAVLQYLAFLAKTLSILGLVYVVLHESREQFPSAARSLPEGLLIHDSTGRVLFANLACAKFLGYDSIGNLHGRIIQELMPIISNSRLHSVYQRLANRDESFPLYFESSCQDRLGRELSFEMFISPYWQGGQLLALCHLRDISKRKHQEARLQLAANVDDVTQLASRHALNEALRLHIGSRDMPDKPYALLFIDLDHFKRINDSLGHVYGDRLLYAAGVRLKQLAGVAAFVARFGGDELVVLLPCSSQEQAAAEALHLAKQVEEQFRQPFMLDSMNLVVTTSIGIALFPEQASDGEALLRYADSAMYAAKRQGRNQCCLFNPRFEQEVRDSLVIDNELRQALDADEFSLVYQPIVDANDSHVCKVEALVRWRSSRLGAVSPDVFIPVAEESGLIVPLGTWVLRKACLQLGEWLRASLEPNFRLRVSVNVSAWQLVCPDFVAGVQQALALAGIDAAMLELELTERTLIQEDPQIMLALRQLQEMGVKFALDDFGTGYSSLSYLWRFPLDTLKIDRAFISDLENNPRCLELTQHIIGMGAALGLQLVAEGVETASQASMLRKFGCDQLQGYLFAKPLPADELASHFLVSAPQFS